MTRRRLFFALWPDQGLAAALQRFARIIEPEAGRVPATADLHVTLGFLGSLEDALLPALAACAGRIQVPAFEIRFDRVEHWQRSRTRVLACDRPVPAAALLAAAVRGCAAGVGVVPEEDFQPHLTLVRGLPTADGRGAVPVPEPFVLHARKFYLAESQLLESGTASTSTPVRYRHLQAWPLL